MQSNGIPIFIHHEMGEKSTIACGNRQNYVRYCVKQAEKYNDEVILFGDEKVKKYADKWEKSDLYLGKKWDSFLEVFENYSDYPLEWAKGIFKRFFIFEEYMKKNNIDKCVILDSDVLIYHHYSEDDIICRYDAALQIESNQRLDDLPYDNDLRWVAIAGFAYFTLKALTEFTDFCIEIYKNNKAKLQVKWNVHQKYNLPGGVNEMSLLYLWSLDTKYKIFNLYNKNFPFDNAINNIDGYIGDKYGLKKVKYVDNIPFVKKMLWRRIYDVWTTFWRLE